MDGIRQAITIRWAAALLATGSIILIAVVSRTAPVAAAAAEAQNPVATKQESISRGRILYSKHCASCHGPSGHGDGPAGHDLDPRPSDLCEPAVMRQSDRQLFRKITMGRRPMPSFRKLLDDGDRWHVVNYIRTLAPPAEAQQGR